jgi:HPt (histidine-containing phosphotransfer) domain-containing protein
MESATTTPKRLISRLVEDDPEMADIVTEFVDALPTRVRNLQDAWREKAWDQLRTIAHQLKGAGGSYGYPTLSELGATMEQSFKAQRAEQFDAWITTLNSLIEAARAGLTRP